MSKKENNEKRNINKQSKDLTKALVFSFDEFSDNGEEDSENNKNHEKEKEEKEKDKN